MKAISTHIENAGACEWGCASLCSILEGSGSHQKEACEKGGLTVLFKALREHTDDLNVSELCCGAIGTILSSLEVHSKHCAPEVIRAVEECYEKHKDSEWIKQFLLSLKREEDPRVCDAVARGVCTKEVIPKVQ